MDNEKLTDLLAHPSTNCPRCGGLNVSIVGTPHDIGDSVPCPNDFHTITPERTERELMGIVTDACVAYALGPKEEEYSNSLADVAIAVAQFCNAREIVPLAGEIFPWVPSRNVREVINRLTTKYPRRERWGRLAIDGIQSLATAAGIDLWEEIVKQLKE